MGRPKFFRVQKIAANAKNSHGTRTIATKAQKTAAREFPPAAKAQTAIVLVSY
jgi:hypothetical protein